VTSPQGTGAEAAAAASADDTGSAKAPGYWETTSSGKVYGFGVPNYGDLSGDQLNRPIVGIASQGGNGYWLVASDGGIFSFGTAQFHGSTGGLPLNKPIVGMAATPDGGGYWLVASDGGIFAYGDAAFYGSTGGLRLNKPIVGMAPTPDGKGYWLVASDGGIFAFGDAAFYGSTGSLTLNKPIVGMAAMPDGGGYDLIASDGGIFSYGDAPFEGSTGSLALNKPIIGGAASADGQGYWLTASDGGIFAFGDAQYEGSAGGSAVPAPVVGIAATAEGNPYPAGSTGYDISWPQFLPDYNPASPTNKNLCDTPRLPLSGSPVSVVGVNNGVSTGLNTCFTEEAAWAGTNMSVYINVDNLTAQTAAASYQTGANDAAADVAYVEGDGYRPQIWWLDVEAPCGYSGSQPGGTPLWQCGAAGQALNDAVIQGALSVLRADGFTAGIYSTYLQWPATVGPGVSLAGTPIWIATVPSNTTQWAQDCTTYAIPSKYTGDRSFTTGTPYLVQWAGGQPGVGFDQDYACGV
jgi:hypothetical protein